MVLVKNDKDGFSLLEVIITLAILGGLAAFTIPSVFHQSTSSQAARFQLINKNAAYMVVSAYEQYKTNNPSVAATVGIKDLTPYMQYLAVDTTSVVDNTNGSTTASCITNVCLKLHSGAMLYYYAPAYFNGTGTTNAIYS